MVFSQSDMVSLEGLVLDAATHKPLENANCLAIESNQSRKTDSEGKFRISLERNLEQHLGISHQGCVSETFHIKLTQDTTIIFYLIHYHKHLKEVKVGGKRSIIVDGVSADQIDVRIKENLTNLLEKTTGVRSMRNGNSIAKPIVQGLYGNRLTILNQGVAQTGQQWGNDHAPEIDPLAGNRIRVIKGVSSLEYKGVQMGALIAVESDRFKDEPHLHGKLSSFFESNGLALGVNLQVEQNQPNIAWRFTGTYKNCGDKSTSDYYLRNTGSRELNFSFLSEKTLFKHWRTSLYLSTFNTELGVLRGSHIGNTTDLYQAFGRDKPFFTEDDYRRDIDPPRQLIGHHLWKLSSNRSLDSNHIIGFMYAGQINNRKEFDIRRGGRSDIPVMYIFQHSHFFEGKWTIVRKNSTTRTGTQLQYTENINQPETGITPLIPNYSSLEPSLFLTHSHRLLKSQVDMGFRYDLQLLNVYTTTKTIPRENLEFFHLFSNLTFFMSYIHHLNDYTEVQLNSGLTVRNPAINELYSFGLHQGVASIEEGNAHLVAEKSFKTSISIQNTWTNRFSTEAQLYFHNINDFIYLRPEAQTRLTIRGAYPVFVYAQTHAQLYGFDANIRYKILEGIDLSADYSYLRGINLTDNLPLIFMPANRLRSEVEFTGARWGKFQNPTMTISGQYTFRQDHLNAEQDFMPAPDGYLLWGCKFSVERQIKSQRILVYLQMENLFNVKYRDYLNRLRYFADDMGRNITLGMTINY